MNLKQICNQPAFEFAKAQSQPPWILTVILTLVLVFGQQELKRLIEWSWMNTEAGRCVWLLANFSIAVSVVFYIHFSFPKALLLPAEFRPSWNKIIIIAALCSLPWLILYIYRSVHVALEMTNLFQLVRTQNDREQINQLLGQLHRLAWANEGYGIDGFGIVLASAGIVMWPWVEEILCRGYLLNDLFRRLPVWTSLLAATIFFVAIHIFRTPDILTLIQFFLMGIACGISRLWTGSWIAAGLTHVLINIGILLPKWEITIITAHWVGKLS